jgi:hypothetical protein
MLRLRQLATLVAVLTLAATGSERVLAQDNDKSAVEATVRRYEQACEQFDFAKANSMLAPGARWILTRNRLSLTVRAGANAGKNIKQPSFVLIISSMISIPAFMATWRG